MRKFSKDTLERAKDGYLQPNENTMEEYHQRVSSALSMGDDALAKRLYEYGCSQWLSYSSPIGMNAGTRREGSLISCFLQTVDDSIDSITQSIKEYAHLSVSGGGVAGEFKNIRPIGTMTSKGVKTPGLIPFLKVFDSSAIGFKQGSRRGAYASYLNIGHPEIKEFLTIRKIGNGDQNRKCLNLHHAVIIPDEFMVKIDKIYRGELPITETWDLINPHTNEVEEQVSAIWLWEQILKLRLQTGEPYIMWIDRANKFNEIPSRPIEMTNLCSEVFLHTSPDVSAVCALSSVNLKYWDEFKDNNQFWYDVVTILDNVLDIFVEKHIGDKVVFDRVKRGIIETRDIGIGTLGLYDYFMDKKIPFDNPMAVGINKKIFTHFQKKLVEASEKLGEERGVPELLSNLDIKRRNLNVSAIAPNATSAILCGNCSAGIEPRPSLAYTQKTSGGTIEHVNPILRDMLEEKCVEDVDRAIHEIKLNGGSIKSTEYESLFTDYEIDVLKTSREMNQQMLAHLNGVRQTAIDHIGAAQGMSFNMFFENPVDIDYVHNTHMEAWKMGSKSVYYCRSTAGVTGEKINQQIVVEEESCVACSN